MPDYERRDRRPIVAGAASALIAVLFFGWFVTLGPGKSRGAEPSALDAAAAVATASLSQSRPVATTSSVLTPGVVARTPAPGLITSASAIPLTESAALKALQSEAAADGARLQLQGQWAAQLASKYVGTKDAAQQARNGSHTFFALDILAEHEEITARVRNADVWLLDSRRLAGDRNDEGNPYWVTVATSAAFTNADKILAWCTALYPNMTATARTNLCLPTQLNPA